MTDRDVLQQEPGIAAFPRRWRWAAAATLAVLAAGVVLYPWPTENRPPVATPSPAHGPPPTGPPIPAGTGVPVGEFAAVALGGTPLGGAMEHRDPAAERGPWTVTVRRADGSLGTHGAVVTFPIEGPALGDPVRVGGAIGRAANGLVTWPIAGALARIRGDLTRPELLSIAAAASVLDGRVTVRAPTGFAVVAATPYRSPVSQGVRYGTVVVDGPESPLGAGLLYTGMTRGGGFEDRLYAHGGVQRLTVGGRPMVVSVVGGGNGTLAWEPAPGVVAYIGYSVARRRTHDQQPARRLRLTVAHRTAQRAAAGQPGRGSSSTTRGAVARRGPTRTRSRPA